MHWRCVFSVFPAQAGFRHTGNYTQKEMAPSSVGGGKIKSSQEESNLLLSMPPADARAAQGKIVSRADAQPGASPAELDLKEEVYYDDGAVQKY